MPYKCIVPTYIKESASPRSKDVGKLEIEDVACNNGGYTMSEDGMKYIYINSRKGNGFVLASSVVRVKEGELCGYGYCGWC